MHASGAAQEIPDSVTVWAAWGSTGIRLIAHPDPPQVPASAIPEGVTPTATQEDGVGQETASNGLERSSTFQPCPCCPITGDPTAVQEAPAQEIAVRVPVLASAGSRTTDHLVPLKASTREWLGPAEP
jgi:hypothetical protein